MARPRTHSDDELLERIEAALAARTRVDWTLAEVATAAGVHAATLVKRFGSKRGLLAAVSERWIDSIPTRPTTEDPLRELGEWIDTACTPPTDRPSAAADIALLLEDLADDELGALVQRGWSAQATYVHALLDHAQAIGAVDHAPEPSIAAQILIDTCNGQRLRQAAPPHTGANTARSLLESWT